MFKFLTDSVENAIDVASGSFSALTGEPGAPTKRQVAKLIADGLTVAGAAAALGVATDVVEALMDGDQ